MTVISLISLLRGSQTLVDAETSQTPSGLRLVGLALCVGSTWFILSETDSARLFSGLPSTAVIILKVAIVGSTVGGMALFLACSIALGIMGLHDRRVAPDLDKHRSGLEGERMLPKYLASLDDRFV